ncbi:GNAT family N-acetyltransferase [Wenxinia saemankumensis]|uniref:GNAT family N-acetyltransferase n=1 Tax=Wenxinia saemankumensis TaxID=1447782 RepID=UPI00147F2A67|nr:GNAT family N-acetyltransferase [Wenxinia saemankumensis]
MPALAALHVAVWRETYAGLAPAGILAQIDLPRRVAQWEAVLAAAEHGSGVVLAEAGGALAGFVSWGAPRHGPLRGAREIHTLYVAAGHRRAGLGRRLLSFAFDAIRQAGPLAIGLAVLDGNAAARRAYAALGGREIDVVTDPGPLWRSRDVIVLWDADTPLRA